jgi:hypothetical protein
MPEPIRYNSTADLAVLFGVRQNTVDQWRSRYRGTPAQFPDPDVTIGPFAGWLPGREAELLAWRRSLPGRGSGGGRPRRKADG